MYDVRPIIAVKQVTDAVAKEAWKILAWTRLKPMTCAVEKYERFRLNFSFASVGKWHKNLVSNELIKIKLTPWRDYEADISSDLYNSPCHSLWRGWANAQKDSLIISIEKCTQQSHKSWVQIRHSSIDFFRSLSFLHKLLISLQWSF